MRSEENESLVQTMDKYEKIMKKIAVNRVQPSKRIQLKIEGTLYTHMDQEEFLREFTEWLDKEKHGARFIGDIKNRE